ncbi:hypothetical protein G7Y89_g2584 [Cudoniella acicularis]|uniref:Uncharacterized protein n=1 Tax=Cudoniella acicularis TaxID=354080 RepID=A0A8H4RU94_9HELO|nr:hypothetical protein G7Y89_g2584 [Cudoniella acicularis]
MHKKMLWELVEAEPGAAGAPLCRIVLRDNNYQFYDVKVDSLNEEGRIDIITTSPIPSPSSRGQLKREIKKIKVWVAFGRTNHNCILPFFEQQKLDLNMAPIAHPTVAAALHTAFLRFLAQKALDHKGTGNNRCKIIRAKPKKEDNWGEWKEDTPGGSGGIGSTLWGGEVQGEVGIKAEYVEVAWSDIKLLSHKGLGKYRCAKPSLLRWCLTFEESEGEGEEGKMQCIEEEAKSEMLGMESAGVEYLEEGAITEVEGAIEEIAL